MLTSWLGRSSRQVALTSKEEYGMSFSKGTDKENLSFLKALAVTELPHLFHFSCYLIAELNGESAGALGGYDPDVLGYDALRKALPEVFRKLQRPIPDLTPGARSSTVLACIPESVEGA